MTITLDIIGTYECADCQDLARPGSDYCTSCRDWSDHGVLPTTLASARAVAEHTGLAAVDDPDVELARVLQQVTDRLMTLERRSSVHALPGSV